MLFIWISRLCIAFSMFFMLMGIIGIFRFKDFYLRILISSKIETVGLLSMMIGLMFFSGLTFTTLKIILICLVLLFTNPLSTHAIARSAKINGYISHKEITK